MSSTQFQTLTVRGTNNPGKSVSFSTNVIHASAAVQSFKMSYGPDTDQYVDTIEVSISNINWNGTQVNFDVKGVMSSEDDTTTASGDTSITVLVVAYVE